METSIIPFGEDEGLSKRMIADALRRVGLTEVYNSPRNVKESYYDTLAHMIWEGIVEGVVYFTDGSTFSIPSLKEGPKMWMEMVRFIAQHLDGGVGINQQYNTMNVFKVYQGIDSDRV